MTTAADLKNAETRARLARERLQRTTSSLQTKLAPAELARQAVDGITEGGERALQTGVDAAQRNPRVAIGAASVAFLLLLRRPLMRRFRRKKVTGNPTPEQTFGSFEGVPAKRIEQ